MGILEGCANLVGRRVLGCTPSVRRAVGEAAFDCDHCPGVPETAQLNRYTKAVPQRAKVAMWPRPKPDVAMMEVKFIN